MLSLVAIVWVNAYLIRQVFFIEHTAQMHSMHGYWLAIARLAGVHWFQPSWWPWWYNGMPFEHTYAPLVPALIALISKISGVPHGQALNIVSGLVFCLGPAALFLMAWQLTRRPGLSFLAAAVYSVSASTELILPDDKFSFGNLANARRLYVNFIWDETPHLLALIFICLAVVFLHRTLRGGTTVDRLLAGASMAAAVLANPFGGTTLMLLLICYFATVETPHRWQDIRATLAIGIPAYLVISPFFPPSLALAIRRNTQLFLDSAWSARSAYGLAITVAGFLLLWLLTRKWMPWHLRFFLLFSFLTAAFPWLLYKHDMHFIPQPGRYKVELELILPLLLVFSLATLTDRLPVWCRTLTCLALLWPAVGNVIEHRRFSKRELLPRDITQTFEYRVAKWVEQNLPGRRVLAGGSIGQWMNAFTDTHQFGGGSYPTAYNPVQLLAQFEVFWSNGAVDPNAEKSTPALQAYGVDALIAPGKQSPEFWKACNDPKKFERDYRILWREQDTTIFEVPRPAAPLQWLSTNRVRVRSVHVPINYHPGWKASNAGISADAYGLIVLHPYHPSGAFETELVYDGGWEAKLTRSLALLTTLGVILAVGRRIRARPRLRGL